MSKIHGIDALLVSPVHLLVKSFHLCGLWIHSRLLFLPIRLLPKAESAGVVQPGEWGSPWCQPTGK